MTAVDNRTVRRSVRINVGGTDQEARDLFDGTLRRGQTDANKFRLSSFKFRVLNLVGRELSTALPGQLFQTFDRKGEVRPALVANYGVDFINDQCARSLQHATAAFAR